MLIYDIDDQSRQHLGLLWVKVAHTGTGPSCSNSHIPGYINHKNLKSAGDVFVVAVNDPFVWVLPAQSVQLIVSDLLKHKSLGWSSRSYWQLRREYLTWNSLYFDTTLNNQDSCLIDPFPRRPNSQIHRSIGSSFRWYCYFRWPTKQALCHWDWRRRQGQGYACWARQHRTGW